MGIFSAFAGLLGGMLTNKSNRDSVAANNAATARENSLNRQFAHNEANLSHKRMLEIMDKENSWNTYANQRRLLEEAGYNPNALFNSSSTLSASSGASGGAQASSPPVGYPRAWQMDPQLLSVFSDINLKNAQAKNLDADARLKGSQTSGQDLQNIYQDMLNGVYKQYGKLQAEYDLNNKDADTALKDSARLLNGVEQSLKLDELVNMRPKQAAQIISQTVLNQSSDLLNKAVAAKTDKEREYLVKNYLLQSKLVAATCANYYAQAYWTRTQANLWQPDLNPRSDKGLMYRINAVQGNTSAFQLSRMKSTYRDVYDSWRESTINALKANGLYNSRIAENMTGFTGDLIWTFDVISRLVPASSGVLKTPSSPMSLGF